MALSGKSSHSGVLASTDPFFKLLEVLREDRLVKVLAEPTIVTLSNRPVSYHAGGQSRVAVSLGNGRAGVEYKKYGTIVDFLPVVLADQTIHLKCRVEVSQLDPATALPLPVKPSRVCRLGALTRQPISGQTRLC